MKRLTAAIPGCGGAFKVEPGDFEVEEVPAYAAAGAGEHLFLWIEKRGRSTPEVATALAAQLGVPAREVTWAGLKDRFAVTRQLLCVPARAEAALPSFALEGVAVLWARRHGNRLRTGHLLGNRFRVRLRDVRDAGAARASLGELEARGLPNFFGAQRFGRAGDNAREGRAVLAGAPRDRFSRKLGLSALQSQLFNRALGQRLEAGTFGVALAGDVLKKPTGGEFVCEDPAADQPRVDAFEVSPAGPLFGPKMLRAGGDVDRAELALLAEEGLTLDDFRAGGRESRGGRRPYRVRVEELSVEEEGSDLVLAFRLPAGSYATVLLGEVL